MSALFFVLIPLVQSEVVTITRRVPDLFAQFTARVAPILEEKFGVTLALDFDSLRDFVTENAQEARRPVGEAAVGREDRRQDRARRCS